MEYSYEVIMEALRRKNIRLSHQRLKIAEYLCRKGGHPTVEEIYAALHETEPTLSKTTIYNTLHALADAGLVRTLSIEDTELRYDVITAEHGHFKCERCGEIFNFNIRPEVLDRSELDGFRVTERSVYFKGVCPKCLEKE